MPRLAAVVVLPTPPFWFASAIVFNGTPPPTKKEPYGPCSNKAVASYGYSFFGWYSFYSQSCYISVLLAFDYRMSRSSEIECLEIRLSNLWKLQNNPAAKMAQLAHNRANYVPEKFFT